MAAALMVLFIEIILIIKFNLLMRMIDNSIHLPIISLLCATMRNYFSGKLVTESKIGET